MEVRNLRLYAPEIISAAFVLLLVGVVTDAAIPPLFAQGEAGVGINGPAYTAVNTRASQNQAQFFVYQDMDSGFNHGFPSSLFGTAMTKLHRDPAPLIVPKIGTPASTALKKLGFALYQTQIGEKHESAKPLRGFESPVWEVRADDPSGNYRAIYVVHLRDAVYVLHAFQEKAKSGIATPKREIELIRQRLKFAAGSRVRGKFELCPSKITQLAAEMFLPISDRPNQMTIWPRPNW